MEQSRPTYFFPLLPAYYHAEAPAGEAFNQRQELRSSYLSEHRAQSLPLTDHSRGREGTSSVYTSLYLTDHFGRSNGRLSVPILGPPPAKTQSDGFLRPNIRQTLRVTNSRAYRAHFRLFPRRIVPERV